VLLSAFSPQSVQPNVRPPTQRIAVATISTPYTLVSERSHTPIRDLTEVIFGFGLIMLVLWLPQRAQVLLSPIAFMATLSIVLLYRPSRHELGLDATGLLRSLWILPASGAFVAFSVLAAQKLAFLHPLYQADLAHVGGYVLWTCYQQFLLQAYFMPRLQRLLARDWAAVALTAVLFAVAHLPNLSLTAVTLLWGLISCLLFLSYRSILVLGIAQGLLGLCFAVCVPDALHHHMRVGLGYLHYNAALTLR